MISKNVFRTRTLFLPVIVLAIHITVLCAAASVYGGNPPSFIPGAPVPLLLDPTVSTFRVPPESHPQGIRPATATVVVTVSYVPAGSYGQWATFAGPGPLLLRPRLTMLQAYGQRGI